IDIRQSQTSVQAKYDFHMLAAMKQVAHDYAAAFRAAAGNAPFCWLNLDGVWSWKEAWALAEDIAHAEQSPAWQGFSAWAGETQAYAVPPVSPPTVDVAAVREKLGELDGHLAAAVKL